MASIVQVYRFVLYLLIRYLSIYHKNIMPYIPMRPQQFISMIDLFFFFLIKHVLARVCILLEQDIFVNIPFYLFSYENT